MSTRRSSDSPKTAVVHIEDYKDSPEDNDLPDGLVLKAQDLSNLDNRPSVLGDDLPQGLVVEGRKSFAIPDAQRAVGIRVANPRLGEWVQAGPRVFRHHVRDQGRQHRDCSPSPGVPGTGDPAIGFSGQAVGLPNSGK